MPLRAFLLLGTCGFAGMASMRVCDAMLPALVASFSVTTGQAAGTISGFALAYGVMQLFYGPMADRYGKLRVIGFATMACTLGNAGAALSPTFDWLLASRVLSGVAAAGIIPLALAWIGDSVSYEDRQDVLARFLTATILGMIGGQWLGGLAAAVLGWRLAFGLLTVLFLAAGTMLALRQPSHPPQAVSELNRVGVAARMWNVWLQPGAQAILWITFIEGALAFSVIAFIPTHLHGTFDLSLPVAGGIVAVFGLGGLVYSRCVRMLRRRIGEAGLAIFGGLCMGLAFLAIAFAPTWHLAIPGCFVAGFGFYSFHNTLQTNATQMAPATRGTAMSMFACVLFLGQSIGLAGSAWAVDRYSTSLTFAASAAGLMLLGVVFAARIRQRGRQAQGAST